MSIKPAFNDAIDYKKPTTRRLIDLQSHGGSISACTTLWPTERLWLNYEFMDAQLQCRWKSGIKNQAIPKCRLIKYAVVGMQTRYSLRRTIFLHTTIEYHTSDVSVYGFAIIRRLPVELLYVADYEASPFLVLNLTVITFVCRTDDDEVLGFRQTMIWKVIHSNASKHVIDINSDQDTWTYR